MLFTTFAGLPATIQLSGIFSNTIDPANICTLSPMCIPPASTLFVYIVTLFPKEGISTPSLVCDGFLPTVTP